MSVSIASLKEESILRPQFLANPSLRHRQQQMVHPNCFWRHTSSTARLLCWSGLGTRPVVIQHVIPECFLILQDSAEIRNSYVFGGIGAAETALGDVWVLSLPSFTWIYVSFSSSRLWQGSYHSSGTQHQKRRLFREARLGPLAMLCISRR